MYHSQIILSVFQEKKLSAYKVSKESGISESLFSKWKTNPTSEITSKNLVKLADYLDCSVDYLLGRTTTTNETNSHNTISGNNNIIGNGNNTGENLSEQETVLVSIFKDLDVINQAKLLTYAASLKNEVKK